ncbi:MFS transporter [Spirillospora sp. NPDC050679]
MPPSPDAAPAAPSDALPDRTPDTLGPPAGRTLGLIAVLLAVFVVPSSISGTAVALPAIGADTHAGPIALQWAVNAFNLAFACCTLVWGSVADIIGRVRAFAVGAAVYALASLGSVLAPGIGTLDLARAAAGIGGAAIFSCGSAILAGMFDGPARARAFALLGTVAGLGVSFGPSVSGLLVQALGWRWVFAVHAVVLALVLAVVPVLSRAVAAPRRAGARVDVPGSGLFMLAMLLLTGGIVQGSQWGWASPGVLGLFAGAALALAAFAAVERRRPDPMLDLGLLGDRRFLALCLVPVAGSFGFVTLLTYLPSYLTEADGRSSGAAGLIMVLLTAPMLVCPLLAARLVARGVPAMAIVFASLGLLVAGDLALLLFAPGVAVAVVAVPMLVTGAGMALAAGLVDGRALDLVAPEKAGMAAGFLNTLRLGSEAVAVAAYGSLLTTLVTARTGGGADRVTAYDAAFHTMLWALAGVCLALTAVIAALWRGARSRPAAL